ncbi:B-4DMT family transporter [Haloechinothrix sp. LS1_15]|uniref:B-4DMT family transporter n=1 Tax=Haloechinothrix sp. LS1_15 TaxID=2652248 RepID=UPI00294639DD|nr:B-4DMT family transporter [Haloechinothrix sp. LS1_15]MDV6013279.1 hypothetical protein [Haloechinothrix sp. LS1_15]
MPAWLLRGLVLAVVHAAVSVSLAKLAVIRPTESPMVTSLAFALLIGTAAAWSAVDGWLRAPNRGRTWVIATAIAAVGAGILDVAGRAAFVDQTGISALGDALTAGAAFVALLVLLPAGLGLFVGGRLEPPVARSAGSSTGSSAEKSVLPDEQAGEDHPKPGASG